MLAAWFGPLWADKHKLDSQGRIFLNCDPYCFEQILSFLRCKLIEHPDSPAQLPVIRQESQAKFATLVEYLGVLAYMPKSTFHFSKAVGTLLTEGGCVAEALTENSVAFTDPAMQPGALCYVKCNILSHSDWMFFGVTQLLEPKEYAEDDDSSFGWSTKGHYDRGFAFASKYAWQTNSELVFKMDLTLDVGVLSLWTSRHSCVFEVKLEQHCSWPLLLCLQC